MKAKWIEVKRFLEFELKKKDTKDEQKKSIQNTISFLEDKYDKSQEQWNEIVSWVKEKLPEWNKQYPVRGCELKPQFYNTSSLTAFSIHLEGSNHSDSLLEIHFFPYPLCELVVFTIEGYVDIIDLPILNFDEVYDCIQNTFTHNKFQRITKEAESQTKTE